MNLLKFTNKRIQFKNIRYHAKIIKNLNEKINQKATVSGGFSF